MYMFQLNSYKNALHFRWLWENAAMFWTRTIFTPAKKAKKPYVYTARVKRMLATAGLVFAAVIAAAFVFSAPYNYLAPALLFVCSPLVPLLTNIVNAPIEAAVRRYYINDARRILRACPDLIVIGITGSYGKTSVKQYLTTLLKAKYNVLMTPESYNTPMGVVKTIRENLRSTHEIFVCEMGARHKGDIKELCDIVAPRHGIITAVGEQHLETMKTIETITKTKFELAEAVAGQGVIFLNGDNAHIREHLPAQDFQTYGLQENNDCRAYDIKATTSGTLFSVVCHGEKIEGLQTPLIGEHNIVNIAGTLAVAAYLGVSSEEMRRQLKKIAAPPHRLQLVRSNGMVLIDDAYNSNPSGCEAALKTLAMFEGYKILLTPGMVELGTKQDECNYIFGEQAAAVCDHVILVGEKQTKPIYEGLRSKDYNTTQIQVANTFDEALNKAYTISTGQQKIILIENDLPDNY
jgi:UDP-N-acetylmuramoyl-tripeptide--D-alanyl-D-alanine ligase